MTSTIQVVIFLYILVQTAISSPKDDKEMSVSAITEIPGLALLKNVRIWKNNKNIFLRELYGPNIESWVVEKDDTKIITEMSLTALCCLYSIEIINFIRLSEQVVETFNHDHVSNMSELESLKPFILQMLVTVLEFKNKYHTSVDKHLLNSLLSIYLYLNSINPDNASTVDLTVDPAITAIENLKRLNLIVQNIIEAFTIQNCSSESLDDDPYETRDEYLSMISTLSFPETYYKEEFFDMKALMLTEVLETELIADKDNTRLKHITVSWKYQDVEVQHVYISLLNDCYSENITKFQTMIFDCLTSVVFCLIETIVELSYVLTNEGQTLDPSINACITAAINTLDSFDFPGLVGATLRKMKIITMLVPDANNEVSQSIKQHFQLSSISKDTILAIINAQLLQRDKSVEKFTEILDNFRSRLETLGSYIGTAVEVNKTFCDYEYEEMGFLQYAPTSYQLKTDQFLESSCHFSVSIVKHFLLIDSIIGQCTKLAFSLSNKSYDYYSSHLLVECFGKIESSAKFISDKLFDIFTSLVNSIVFTGTLKPTNRKLIDSILAAELYFNNETIFLELHESADPQTEGNSINVALVVSKLEVLRRTHQVIINLVEQFTVHNCAVPLPCTEITQSVITKIRTDNCDGLQNENDNVTVMGCVDKLIVDNYTNVLISEPYANSSEFAYNKLLMDDVFERARSSTELSGLLDVRFYWQGEQRSLMEISSFVKNHIDPKYLTKYQLTMIKAVIFVVYEKMKTVVRNWAKYNDEPVFRNNIEQLLKLLEFIPKLNFAYSVVVMYKTMIRLFEVYFENIFNNNNEIFDANRLINVIQTEQSHLGITNEFDEVKDHDETVQPTPKNAIFDIVEFTKEVEDLWTSLRNVVYVLKARKVVDIAIQ